MGLTLCTLTGALRRAHHWFVRLALLRSQAPLQRPAQARRLNTAPGRAHVCWPPAPPSPVRRRPLRVLRIVDAGHGPSIAGRLVISGRMADVCEELDRLVALEASAA